VTEKQEMKSHVGVVNLERRRHPRFSIDLPIEYHLIPSSISHTGRALNASEGGLLVYLSQPVEIGQHLKMKLFFASGSDLNSIEVLAEVVWMDIHLGKERGDYRCGVKFADISQDDFNKLKNFLIKCFINSLILKLRFTFMIFSSLGFGTKFFIKKIFMGRCHWVATMSRPFQTPPYCSALDSN
jgi:hypothetical protein